MEHTNFNYKTPNKKDIVKHVLYENAIFNVKDVFSNKTSDETCSVSVMTPTQMISVTFPYTASPDGHAGMTHILIRTVYPNDHSHFYLGQRLYMVERANNLFIVATKDGMIVILPEKNRITQSQYDSLENYFKEFQESDYAKAGKINNIVFAQDVEKGDIKININEIDNQLERLKKYIVEKDVERKENPISEFDFSDCTTSEEFMEKSEFYANQLVENSKINLIEPIIKTEEDEER